MNRFRLLVAWLKQNLHQILAAAMSMGIFVVIFLYQLPLEPVGYAAALTILAFAVCYALIYVLTARTYYRFVR